jgi:AraC-like DNA-binding protein
MYIAGISISFFMAALLLNKKDKSPSDKYLLAWMILNVIHLSIQYTYATGYMLKHPFLYGILAPLPLLHGVYLYLYVASVTNQFPKKSFGVWGHFIPTFLFYIYLLRYYFFIPAVEQVKVLESKGAGHEHFMTLLFLSVMMSGVIYVVWSSLLLKKHKNKILNNFSELEKVNLRWLQFLVYGLGALWAIIIFSQKEEYIFFGVVIFVILTGFFGIQQIDIYHNRRHKVSYSEKNKTIEKKVKYAKSGLSKEASEHLFSELISLMENKKVYKQPDLSIGELAEFLETHPNYLSQVINEKTGSPFYDFINNYRLEAFKKLVKSADSQKFTILSMAYECGFSSKSSFNRYFKKVTGHTPSHYINSLNE